LPLFAKEGNKSSLWQREVGRDFINNVVINMKPFITVAASVRVRNSFIGDHSISRAITSDDPPRRKTCGYQGRCSPGFTLIEILIAVAILSILLAAIYSTFFLSYKAIEGMDESMVKLQEARRALDILKREIDSTFYAVGDQNTFFRIVDRDVYGKQATRLEFTAFSPQRPGVSRITYFIEDKEGKLVLFKKVESPYRKEETEEADIIEDMDSFGIEAKFNDTWVKTWDTGINKDMPEEVRINLAITIKGRTVTLSDISSPKIGRTI
jgi:general secretion pathway protein J